MPDKNDPKHSRDKPQAGEEDGYRTDTFSRNDAEGLPGPAEEAGEPPASGEEAGYRTDTFSRNDKEGLPATNAPEAEDPGRDR